MFFHAHNLKVLDTIVEFVAVDMVNVLACQQSAAERDLHDKSVLQNPSVFNSYESVPVWGDDALFVEGNPTIAASRHAISANDHPTIDAGRATPIDPVAITASCPPGSNYTRSAIGAKLSRLAERHSLTSLVGRGVRRARSVSSTAGLFAVQIIPRKRGNWMDFKVVQEAA